MTLPLPLWHDESVVAEAVKYAATFHQRGMLAEAEKFYAAILDVRPDHFNALHLLGVLRRQQGNGAEALRLIGAALKLNPRSVDALVRFRRRPLRPQALSMKRSKPTTRRSPSRAIISTASRSRQRAAGPQSLRARRSPRSTGRSSSSRMIPKRSTAGAMRCCISAAPRRRSRPSTRLLPSKPTVSKRIIGRGNALVRLRSRRRSTRELRQGDRDAARSCRRASSPGPGAHVARTPRRGVGELRQGALRRAETSRIAQQLWQRTSGARPRRGCADCLRQGARHHARTNPTCSSSAPPRFGRSGVMPKRRGSDERALDRPSRTTRRRTTSGAFHFGRWASMKKPSRAMKKRRPAIIRGRSASSRSAGCPLPIGLTPAISPTHCAVALRKEASSIL